VYKEFCLMYIGGDVVAILPVPLNKNSQFCRNIHF
jgi:hypothetical protein